MLNLRDTSNVDILNAIRKNATTDYRRRIPVATAANVQNIRDTLFNYKGLRNEFLDALVNKIGLTLYNSISWENPLAELKSGKVEYGATVEEITMGLIKASTYNHDQDSLEKEVWGRSTADVAVQYHTVNREDKYKNTIEMFTLKRAFLSENGLGSFITATMQMAETSDNWDEFLLMSGLLRDFEREAGFHYVNVPDVSNVDSDGPDARAYARAVRAMAGNLQFISAHYNPLGYPTAAKQEDLLLFTTPEANAAMDVESLAAAFNVEKADVPGRVILIPREHFRIPGAQSIMTTKEFFRVFDTLLETTMIANPAGLYENWWLHHHQIISANLAAPAVVFGTGEGTVINIYDDPEVTAVDVTSVKDRDGNTVTAVERGELYYVTSTVTTDPDDNGNNPVIYKVIGALSLFTRITASGVIHIGLDEEATSIQIEGRAQDDNSEVFDTITVNVVGDRVIFLPPAVVSDSDIDGLGEVTPDAVVIHDANKVTIPTVRGVQYRKTVTSGVTFADTGDLVTVPSGNQLAVGDRIVFGTITSTTGITAGVEYFVKTKPSVNTLTLAATKDGALLPLTTNGSAASATFDVADSSTHTLSGATTFTAVADPASQYELAPGATASWTLTP